MKKVVLAIIFLGLVLARNSYAGPQIFGGYGIISHEQYPTLGFQYSWLKKSDGNWQFLSPGFATGTTSAMLLSLQVVGKRLAKTDRQKWTNPPDLYLGVTLLGRSVNDFGVVTSLSFGW